MEVPQGNPLCKIFFSFTELENRRLEQVLCVLGGDNSGRGRNGERVWKGEWVNVV
jgi:hypothetical protein